MKTFQGLSGFRTEIAGTSDLPRYPLLTLSGLRRPCL